MRRIRFVSLLLCVLMISPLAALSAEFDTLMKDLDTLDQELEADAEEEEQLKVDTEYEEELDLFPDEPDSEIEVRQGQVSDTHVFVRIDGVPLILDDVPLDQWFADYVREMAELGIISGYKDADGKPLGLYGPADDVTIEQLAKIAVESSEVDQSKCPEKAKNKTASGTWSEPYISCAEHLVWSIYSEATVDVSRPATRAEVVVTVLQAFAREFEPATGDMFEDVSSTMAFRNAIETAARDGVVSGYADEDGVPTGFFGPFDAVNRAETAKIVTLAIQKYARGGLERDKNDAEEEKKEEMEDEEEEKEEVETGTGESVE